MTRQIFAYDIEKGDIIQLQPLYEVDIRLYRPEKSISTEDGIRGRYTFLGRYNLISTSYKGYNCYIINFQMNMMMSIFMYLNSHLLYMKISYTFIYRKYFFPFLYEEFCSIFQRKKFQNFFFLAFLAYFKYSLLLMCRNPGFSTFYFYHAICISVFSNHCAI